MLQLLEAACTQLIDDTGRRRAITYTAVKQTMAKLRALQDQRPVTMPTRPTGASTVTGRDTSTAHLAGPEAFSLDALLGKQGKK